MGCTSSKQAINVNQPSLPSIHQAKYKDQQVPQKSKPPKKAFDYEKLQSIPNFHQPKTYKKPTQMVIAPLQNISAHQDYYPHQQDINAELYIGSEFSDANYIASIPKRKENSTLKIDESRSLFFKIGHSPVYSESIYTFIRFKGRAAIWADVEDPSYQVERNMKIPDQVEAILMDKSLRTELMQAGWIVMHEQRWGFLLNIQSIAETYKGSLPDRWRVLLKTQYFQDIVEKFGTYFEELNQQDSQGIIPKDIPSTDFDPYLPEWYATFNNSLFWRQKQEVGWMYGLENYPAIRLRKKFNATPFFDTGRYLDPISPTGFLATNRENDFVDVLMPGGIIASQIGAGKTITAIALTTVGCQLKYGFHLKGASAPLNLQDPTVADMNYWLDGGYEPSLIIVTKNILGQWREEYYKFAPHLKVCVLENEEDLKQLKSIKIESHYTLRDFDVVLTHRKVIEQGDLITEYCPEFFQISFRRVMIDEFHELTKMIKEQFKGGIKVGSKDVGENIEMYNFCLNLKRIDRRFTWGITGTPDSLDYYNDTTPLFILLNLNEKFNNMNTFSKLKDEFIMTCMRKNPRSINLPSLDKSIEKVYFGELQNILYQGKLNYAKNKYAAQEICSHLLPQWRQLEISQDTIEKAIQTIQKKHEDEIAEVQNKLKVDKGNEALQGRLEVLLSEGNFFTEVIKVISQNSFECPICLTQQQSEKIVVTECMHNVCITCYEGLKKAVDLPQCPVCRESIHNNSVLIHPNFRKNRETKLTAILKAIQSTPSEDKIIIFTQFHSLVEHLTEVFGLMAVPFTVLRGEPSDINISLNRFKYVPQLKVLLMSIEQAASGINVTMANHVFFAHPIFGMEFEKAALTYNQCIGRAYRIGQMKQVNVKLFVTADSIEEDMIPAFNKYADTLN